VARTFANVDDVPQGGIQPKDGGNPGTERS